MDKKSFFFFYISFTALSLYPWLNQVSLEHQAIFSGLLILIFGIPHGAVDHLLLLEKNDTSKPLHFYLFYLGMMSFYLLLWLVAPVLSLAIFLFISAYHFGQSQFSKISGTSRNRLWFLSLLWGCSIISGLVVSNLEEIGLLLASSRDLSDLSVLFNPTIFEGTFYVTTALAVLALLQLRVKRTISTKRTVAELFIFLLIHACFHFLPLLIGFTIYFTTWHSFKVLTEEYAFLKTKKQHFSFAQFLKTLLPFSVLSIIGISMVVLLSELGFLEISEILLIFIALSILTLPHSIVMDRFYLKFYGSNR